MSAAITQSNNDPESIPTETTTAASLHFPRSLAPVFESSGVAYEDNSPDDTSTMIDRFSVLRSQISGLAISSGNLAATSSPSTSSPEDPMGALDRPESILLSRQSIPVKPSGLPEDDGQLVLRQKLVEISNLNISERERATLMHVLMSEKYNASRVSGDIADSGSHLLSNRFQAITQEPQVPQVDNPYKLSARDTTKTYYTGPNTSSELPFRELGCSHYRRGVKLQCSTCERWYTCRFCHDENEDHALVRRGTKNMLCMHCGRAQSVGQDCRYCRVRSARYYCDKVCILAVKFSEKIINSFVFKCQILLLVTWY